ncbi:MAG: DUF3256 family protein [Bacteroidales bacterium]
MNKNYFIILIVTFFCTNSFAQDITPYFTIIPDNILGYVNIGLRKDLIDLYNAKQKAEVRNLLGGTTRLDFMSPEYLKLQLSDKTTMEMRMIQNPDDSTALIVVNKTLNTAYPESVLSVYASDWRSLASGNYFEQPALNDFLYDGVTDAELAELKRVIPYDNVLIELDSVKNELNVTPQFFKSMSVEDHSKWKDKIINKPVIYIWKEGRYVKK